MSGSLGSPGPGLELDTVTVEAVPQKKGIILRHVEYTVKYSTVQYSTVYSTAQYSIVQYTVRSDHFRSEVTRRYSDFQALADLLLYRCWVWWVRAFAKFHNARIKGGFKDLSNQLM